MPTLQQTPELLPIRVTVVDPPADVTWAVQLGRDRLIPPSRAARDMVTFELTLRLTPGPARGAPRLLGPVVQGPPAARFLYVSSGRRAGQAASCWDRRAKIPLGDISWTLIRQLRTKPGGALAASIAGRAKDGGPACATVSLLDGGWSVA